MNGPYVILAPHVDDEVIGCWRLLDSGQVKAVFYFYDLTEQRVKEAKECAQRYSFRANFVKDGLTTEAMAAILGEGTILVAPNIADYHPHHKAVNAFATEFSLAQRPKRYYSVDMNVRMDVLDDNQQFRKRGALFTLFPSQHRYIDRHDECWLFESLLDTDWISATVQSGSGKMPVDVRFE